MNIVSLFDGIACGKVALERAGIEIEAYNAYEIDKYALQISGKNHSSIKQCGSVIGADFRRHRGAAKMGQYLFGCITPDRINKKQNGQRFNEGKKFYTLTAQDQHGVLVDGYIRKLTEIECERLQTLPDGYTAGISPAQRYKCLGNGWTVDVITHILRYLSGKGEEHENCRGAEEAAKAV